VAVLRFPPGGLWLFGFEFDGPEPFALGLPSRPPPDPPAGGERARDGLPPREGGDMALPSRDSGDVARLCGELPLDRAFGEAPRDPVAR
jgi:hypothetical protein